MIPAKATPAAQNFAHDIDMTSDTSDEVINDALWVLKHAGVTIPDEKILAETKERIARRKSFIDASIAAGFLA